MSLSVKKETNAQTLSQISSDIKQWRAGGSPPGIRRFWIIWIILAATRIVPTGKMVAALFTHDTSRNLDPEIHTHAVVANVTELDGKWKALATDYIHGAGFIETAYRNQVIYGKIYRNIMKGKTEAIGYETELTGGPHGLWEVKGFSREVIEEFSSRHREIVARVGEEASLKSRDVAALDTRQRKQDISRYGEDSLPTPDDSRVPARSVVPVFV